MASSPTFSQMVRAAGTAAPLPSPITGDAQSLRSHPVHIPTEDVSLYEAYGPPSAEGLAVRVPPGGAAGGVVSHFGVLYAISTWLLLAPVEPSRRSAVSNSTRKSAPTSH